MPTPEDKARENIDRLLTHYGWAVRNQNDASVETQSKQYTSYGDKWE